MRIAHSLPSKLVIFTLSGCCLLLAQPPAGGPGGRGGFGFGGGLGLGSLTGKTITGAPFSANLTSQSVQILANGNQIQRKETAEVARDSQGRVYINATLTRPSSSGTQTVNQITIYDPVAGYTYRLNPQKMTGVQIPIHQRTAPPNRPTPPSNPNVTTTSLGTQTINGVSATGTQVTTNIPAGTIGNTAAIQIVRTTWVSTALQIPVEITVADPRSGNQSTNLTNIVQSEPSASLFTVPSGYTITSPPAGGPRGAFRRR
jgi:hypothetical protein